MSKFSILSTILVSIFLTASAKALDGEIQATGITPAPGALEAQLANDLDSVVLYSKDSPGKFLRIYLSPDSRVRFESCAIETSISCKTLGRAEGYTQYEIDYYSKKAGWRSVEMGAWSSLKYALPIITIFPVATFTAGKFAIVGLAARGFAAYLARSTWIKVVLPVVGASLQNVVNIATDPGLPVSFAIMNFVITYATKLPEKIKETWQQQKAAVSVPWRTGKYIQMRSEMAIELSGPVEKFEKEFERMLRTEPPKPGAPQFGNFYQAKAG